MSRPANVATGKCRDRQMSRPANVATGKCRDRQNFSRQMSRSANVATGKCRDRQMSRPANVAIGKSPTGKSPTGEVSVGRCRTIKFYLVTVEFTSLLIIVLKTVFKWPARYFFASNFQRGPFLGSNLRMVAGKSLRQ